MTSNACTPDNVIGKILGMREANGLEVSKELLDELDTGGKFAYSKQSDEIGADIFDQSEIKGTGDNWFTKAFGDPRNVKRILVDQAGPDEILGNELIDDMDRLIQDYMTGSGEPYQFSKQAYKFLQDEELEKLVGVTKNPYELGFKVNAAKILDSYASNYTGTKASYFKEYREWMLEGGPLFSKENKTGALQAVSNLGDNAIKSSFTVLLGNPIEVAIKLPSLYPGEAAQGLKNWLEAGDFKRKIPELEEVGFYGIERKSMSDANLLEKLNSKWAGLNEYADIPWKNLVYHTGAVKGGMQGGLKAVEDVLFVPRLANMPRQRWGLAGRVESKLLNYSINSIKLGYDLLEGTVKGDRQAQLGLAIMLGSVTALGGPGALVPQPVDDFLSKVNPDYEPLPQWGLSGLLKQQGIGRIAVGYDMASRQGQKAWKSLVDAGQSAGTDNTRAAIDIAHAAVSLAAFSQGWAGDAAVQKGLSLAKDAWLGELDTDFWTDARETYLPFTKAQ